MKKALHVLLVGSTGAVGQAVLKMALDHPNIARVTAPTRRPMPKAISKHAKIDNPVIDFAVLDSVDVWACDAVICTLGTTIKVAGSEDAFARIDRDLPIAFGRLAKEAGASRYALNSSLGASAKGNFYLRTKAQAEQGIIDLGFASVTIVRPSLIDAKREQRRPAEQLGILFARIARPLIPARYRTVTPEQIARALLDGVVMGKPGVNIVESDAL